MARAVHAKSISFDPPMPMIVSSIRGDDSRHMTLGDNLADIDRQLAKMCADAECKHERWDRNAIAKVCLGCRIVLPDDP